MAHLAKKDGVFLARFYFGGQEYKRSLKTKSRADAEAALHSIEQTLHRLLVGVLHVPAGVNAGDFIVSGGTRTEPRAKAGAVPAFDEAVEEFLASQEHMIAESYRSSQRTHLGHLAKHLGNRSKGSVDRITRRDLQQYLQKRLDERSANTVSKERNTLLQFFRWAVGQKYVPESPAAGLDPIKSGIDLPPFRTIEEIDAIRQRGQLSADEERELWECLYLSPAEIADLLATVRNDPTYDVSFLLHAIPAYTGMRRGEVLRLKWIDVDFTQGYLTARSRKQSQRRRETTRRIDLHPELRTELLSWREKRPKGQFVICDAETLEPLTTDQANRCFWKPMRRTTWCLNNERNWFKVGFHTYRHSFASNLAANGVDQRIIDEWMGHQTEAMRRRYRHLFPKNRQEAMTTLSFRLEGESTKAAG